MQGLQPLRSAFGSLPGSHPSQICPLSSTTPGNAQSKHSPEAEKSSVLNV
jgi:hypothetical protein